METLATRLAERNRLRELRAARLARLRAPDARSDDSALEEFLRALTGDPPPPSPPAEPGAVLSFQRPSDLDRLPGAGPGLVWALERAGIRRLADLAPLDPDALAARLGPIGRLVPAQAWIETARAAG
jgi:hypothetical protein